MRAWVFRGARVPLAWEEVPLPEPGPGEVRVCLAASALNHRDLYFLEGSMEARPGTILGSDGAGVICAVGEGVPASRMGERVFVVPSLGWRDASSAPPPGFRILGVPDHGTFAEAVVVPQENAVPLPCGLTWEEAAAHPLAFLTAYRALFTRARLEPGEDLLITGIGGGVALAALQLGVARGARVWVTSRHEEKRARALALGASGAFSSASFAADVRREVGGVDVVLEAVGGATFAESLASLRPGGRIVTFAAAYGGEVQLALRPFFYGQYSLLGTTMGSLAEFHRLLGEFVVGRGVRPVIDRIYPAERLPEALEYLARGEHFGKVVIRWGEPS